MNFGGIIAGALGGGAQAAGEIADANLKEQAAERAEKRSLALNFEKFKQESDYKLQKEGERRTLLADQGERVIGRANANMRGQDAMAVDLLNNKVAGDSPDMSQAEIAQLLKDNPEYRQIYEEAGYMAPRKQSGIIGEQVTAAREIGADPEIRKDLQTTFDRTLTAERDASRERRDEQRYSLQVAREERQASEGAARLSQGDQRLALDSRRFEQLAQGKDKVTSSDKINLNTTISTNQRTVRDANEELKTLRISNPNSPRIGQLEADIADSQRLIKTAQAILLESLEGKRAAPVDQTKRNNDNRTSAQDPRGDLRRFVIPARPAGS